MLAEPRDGFAHGVNGETASRCSQRDSVVQVMFEGKEVCSVHGDLRLSNIYVKRRVVDGAPATDADLCSSTSTGRGMTEQRTTR